MAVTVATWAMAFPAIRVGLDGYAPWALGLLRLLIAAAALGVVAIFVRPRLPSRRQWARIAAAGLIGQTLYQGLLMTGEVSVAPGTASVLIATAPLFSIAAAAVLLRERIGRRWRGFVVAFAGAALVGVAHGASARVSALVVIAAALCQGLYHVLVKPLAEQLGGLSATMWTVWVGAALALPALPTLIADQRTASGGSFSAALFLGIVPSTIGYLAWSDAIGRISVARSTIALYLVPVVAIGVSWVWLADRPTAVALVGATLAIGGVVLARRVPAAPATTDEVPTPTEGYAAR